MVLTRLNPAMAGVVRYMLLQNINVGGIVYVNKMSIWHGIR
jgi:hypothetical protein